MTKAIAEEEFLIDFNEQSNGEYVILGKYNKYLEKIKIKHLTCGHEYDVTPHNFVKRKRRCPKCYGTRRKTHEEFLIEVFERYDDKYNVIGEYVNRNIKLIFKHNECGYQWETLPYVFLKSKHGCPKCSGNIRKKDTEYFKEEVYHIVGNEYSVLGDYKSSHENIEMTHNICGHIWYPDANSFLQGTRCPKCNGGVKKTTEQFKEEVFNLVGDEYMVLGEYKNNITRIEINHRVCGMTSKICPIDFLEGVRCLSCNLSRGEQKIQNFLFKNNITYNSQYTFKDCIYKKQLPFDFAILKDNEVILLIEYDGEQHYIEKDFFGGRKGLELTQIRDKIKDAYCMENNIQLLRIPYWDFNSIEEILHNEFSNINIK
ncbi:zinc-ribbon domain-containing protein [Ureibacillus chungkukjangi]|uniref:zinc-ribbon domain-containing protein n=1 Tax=Ureibacillus chungkukjangi TaxID=1202712 RepID=UPI00203A6637|nr:zinc-ribbon domain-containing protein [Ureibacillus chungkukjangi]MCM3387320.1 zinc-ribbon domain-containing protein [Ureibacillus chungkukjangi]